MRSHTQSVVIEPNRIHLLQAINSDISVLIVCNKTGGTIKGDIKKKKTGCQSAATKWRPRRATPLPNDRRDRAFDDDRNVLS